MIGGMKRKIMRLFFRRGIASFVLSGIGVGMLVSIFIIYGHGRNVPQEEGFHRKDRKLNWKPNEQCQPKKNIVLIVLNEEASFPVINILYRYALVHGLRVMTFIDKPQQFRRDPARAALHAQIHKGDASSKEMYNILAEKISLNKTYLLKNMPQDTVFLTLLQHPVYSSQMIQQLYAKIFNKIRSSSQDVESKSSAFHVLYNSVSKHLGYNDTWMLPERFLENISKQFNFVLLSEELPKCLILLRRLLCWELHDMIHYQTKQLDVESYIEQHHVDYEGYNRLNSVDFQLYEAIQSKLEKKLKDPGFLDEVATLKDLNGQVLNECRTFFLKLAQANVTDNSSIYYRNIDSFSYRYSLASKEITTFDLSGQHCVLLQLKPGVYRNLFRARNFPELCKNNKHTTTVGSGDDIDMDQFIITGKRAFFHKSFCLPKQQDRYIPSPIFYKKSSFFW